MYTRTSLTDFLARKSARVGQVGEDRRVCPARGKLNEEVAGHADILATILARKSARMSVSVLWNSSLMPFTDRRRRRQWQLWRLVISVGMGGRWISRRQTAADSPKDLCMYPSRDRRTPRRSVCAEQRRRAGNC